jgi:hypothetical protein
MDCRLQIVDLFCSRRLLRTRTSGRDPIIEATFRALEDQPRWLVFSALNHSY